MSAIENELIQAGDDVKIFRYTDVAAITLLVYEYLITADGEINSMWPAQLSITKVLFFLNRYVSLVTAILGAYMIIFDTNYSTCKVLFQTACIIALAEYIFAEATLFVRAYAIWDRKRSIGIFLSIITVFSTAGAYYCTVRFFLNTPTSPIRLFHSGCLQFTTDRIEWIALVILVCCETIALSFLLARAYTFYRSGNSASGLMTSMARDGVWYYVVILLTTLVNLSVVRFENMTLNYFLLFPQAMIHSVLCNRLLMRIRTGRSQQITPSPPPQSSH